MAKFITTTEISHQIETLIKDSKSHVILAAPYFNIHKRLRKIIEQKLSESLIAIIVICKKSELKRDEIKWFESQARIQMVNCENLHAKCYLNEQIAILTSMNLYEYSAVNNIEFGFLITIEDDAVNYNALHKECISMIPEVCISKIPEIIAARAKADFALAVIKAKTSKVATFNATDIDDLMRIPV